MIDTFKQSFYSLWFTGMPDAVISKAIYEIENEGDSRLIKSSCRNLYDEWVVLNTVVFLLTFFNNSLLSRVVINDNGEDVSLSLNSLLDTGVVATVKRDAIDANITRDYYEASLPEGMEFKNFPFGKIKDRINDIKSTCEKASALLFCHGSNIPSKKCSSFVTTRSKKRCC